MDTVTITRTTTQEFTYKILNGIAPMDFLIFFIWAIMGMAFTLAAMALDRDPLNPRTPTKFSIKFLIADNANRIIASIFVIIPTILLSEYILGSKTTQHVSFFIGAGVDLCVAKIREIKQLIFKSKNEKTMEEFVISYESNTDMVKGHDGLTISIDQYAANSGGVNNSSVKEIVYDNPTVDVTFVRNDTSTYLSQPVRRPK